MTDLAWWKLGGYVLLGLWLCRVAWLVWDADMGDDE
jgi:hypothetical protein